MIEEAADFLPIWMVLSAAFGFVIGELCGDYGRHRNACRKQTMNSVSGSRRPRPTPSQSSAPSRNSGASSTTSTAGDSDFTPLALKIREHGKPIMIFGHSFTPLALQQAATHFYCIGWFQRQPACQPPCADSRDVGAKREASTNMQFLRSRMDQLIRDISAADGRVTIGTLGATINRLDPIFSPKRYGSPSLRTLLSRLGGFTFKPLEAADGTVQDYEIQWESF